MVQAMNYLIYLDVETRVVARAAGKSVPRELLKYLGIMMSLTKKS